MPQILVGEWLPDQADFNNPGSPTALNVIPGAKDYEPIASMQPYSSALTAICFGAVSYQDAGSNVFTFAGDQNDLYLMNGASSPNFNKVSATSGGYNVSAVDAWKFTQYGNYVIATDYTDAIQVYTLGTSTKFAPLAVYAAGTVTATIGGTITSGDTVSLTISSPDLLSTAQTVTYTVATGNTLANIATALTTDINANTNLASAYISATASGVVVTISQGGTISSTTTVSYAVTGSKTETVTLSPTTGILAGGSDQAPNAQYMVIIRNFLLVGNTNDAFNGAKPQRIWWSGLGNPLQWPQLAAQYAASSTAAIENEYAYSVQSDFQDIIGDYGAITGVIADLGTADGAVFMQRAVFRLVYLGPPDIFSVLPAEGVRGTSSPNSIVQSGALAYYRSDDNFYVFDGTYSQPISDQKVENWFRAQVDPAFANDLRGGVDPTRKLVYWSFASAGHNGIRNMTLIYHTELKRWSVAAFGVQTFSRALSFGYTIEQLSAAFGAIENIPAPFDSPVWAAGRLQLGAFDNSNKLNFFNGPNMAATVDTAETQPYDDTRAYLTNVRPLVDGGIPIVSIGTRNRQEDAVMWTAGTAMNAIGTCPQRAEGRYMRARINQPAGAVWGHIIGVNATTSQMGAR